MDKPIKKIIIINGSGGVGKDAFAKRAIEEAARLSKKNCSNGVTDPQLLHAINNISTIDCVKTIAKTFNWDGSKNERDRKMLSDLKDLLTNYNDYPFKRTKEYIESWLSYQKFSEKDKYSHSFLFVHCREPKEIERLKNQFPDDTFTLLIQNPKVAKVTSNHADREVENYNYDFVVVNNSDLRALRNVAIDFYKKVFEKNVTKYRFIASDYDWEYDGRDW